MARNIGNVVNSINELVAELGLEKLASGVGDPGTTHPAKQDGAEKSNIEPAVEGARSSENTQDVKKEVPGQSIPDAKPEDAKKETAKSSVSNITTATMVGEDPKVERGYVTSVIDPGTTSAASATAKTATDLSKCAADIMTELKTIEEGIVVNATDAREKIASMLNVEEAEKDAAVDGSLSEYITGYVKSAAMVGELTADLLDGMAQAMIDGSEKKAEGEEGMPMGVPAEGEMPAEGEGGEELGMDEEAAALAQAAAEIAAELGVSPEDVLDAAAAELEGAEGGEGAPEGMPAEAAGEIPPEMLEVAASDRKAIAELQEKAAKYDELMKKQADEAAEKKQQDIVKNAVGSALESFMATRGDKKAE